MFGEREVLLLLLCQHSDGIEGNQSVNLKLPVSLSSLWLDSSKYFHSLYCHLKKKDAFFIIERSTMVAQSCFLNES
jgi:hypothetical protein